MCALGLAIGRHRFLFSGKKHQDLHKFCFQNRDAEGVFATAARGRYFPSHKELGLAREVDLHACGGILQSGELSSLFYILKRELGEVVHVCDKETSVIV